MASRTYNRFLVDQHIGTNRKLIRFTPAQRWVYVAGVLALASESPIPGVLLLANDEPVTVRDISRRAGVSTTLAHRAVENFRRLKLIVRDEEFECERVHDWDEWNPPPKARSTEGERRRKQRQRARQQGEEEAA